MNRWSLEEEESEDRAVWHALIELGVLHDRYPRTLQTRPEMTADSHV